MTSVSLLDVVMIHCDSHDQTVTFHKLLCLKLKHKYLLSIRNVVACNHVTARCVSEV